jgi:glycosyltransferase involved in cell wall biosynthesis
MDALVSVIVPLYNGRAFIDAALASLRASTYPNWEAVVVDDGSTDGGGDLVTALAEDEPRIRLVRQENQGLGAARNAGIAAARGECVGFLDADDLWLPHKLERQLAAWREGVVYSDAFLMPGDEPGPDRIGAHVRFVRGQIFDELLEENRIGVLTALLPRALLEEAGGFDATLPQGCEDYELWLRLAARGVPFDYVDEPLAVYRVHAAAMSQSTVDMTRSRIAAYERLLSAAPPSKTEPVAKRASAEYRYLAGALRQRAWRRALEGDREGARGDLCEAQEIAPSVVGRFATAAATRSDAVLSLLARRRSAA